jgi:hypothetical protein
MKKYFYFIKSYIIKFYNLILNCFFYYRPIFKNAFFYYLKFFKPSLYIKSYKEREEKIKKLKNADEKDRVNKEKEIDKKNNQIKLEEKKKKLRIEKERLIDQEKRTNLLIKLKKQVDRELDKSIENWINKFGIYSYRCINSIQLIAKKKPFFNKSDLSKVEKKKKEQSLNKSQSYVQYLVRYNERHKLKGNIAFTKLNWSSDHISRDALLYYQTHINNKDKKNKSSYYYFLKTLKNIFILKTKIHEKKKKNLIRKKDFLIKVLRVLLYVEDREAENLNEQLAKAFFYTRDVNYNFRVRSNNIKVKSLEWTIPSPPPLHTFYVPVRTIVTNDRFFNYKKGKRLLENKKYYNFKETPSVFSKIFRKLTKTYYLFVNFLFYSLGFRNFNKDPNLWYSGSYNVDNFQEYPYTVEYVSQSVRYPFKFLNRYLPFSAGLHNNTISVDLLITPDKSNKVIFGENKDYLRKPSFLNEGKKIIRPYFLLGDRTQKICKVYINKINNNFTNYLFILEKINKELYINGDGSYVSYYLPDIKFNDIHLFFWCNLNIEDPSMNGYIFENFYDYNYNYNQIDSNCLKKDLNNIFFKNNNSIIPLFFKKILFNLYFYIISKKNYYLNLFFYDWYDQQDFSWTVDFFYRNFYIPFYLSKNLNSRSYFYRYFLSNFILKPILGKWFVCLVKSDLFVIKYIFNNYILKK